MIGPRPLLPPGLMARVALVWLLASAALLIGSWDAIGSRAFPGPDDELRMVQLRDLLAGQSWFDTTQYRIDAASGGVAMHWSRLVDLPLMLTVLLTEPLLGRPNAELAAALAIPMLTFALALLLTARIAWARLGRTEALFAALMLALSLPVLIQMRPMRIDHHGWQLVMALLAVNALFSPRRFGRVDGPVLAGLTLAAWLSISLEAAPMVAAFCALGAWSWAMRRDGGARLGGMLNGLAGGSAALFALTQGSWANWCDAISPVHLAMLATGALGVAVLRKLDPERPATLLAGLGAIAAGALAMLWLAAPACLGSTFGLDPLVRTFWYDNVAEGLPVWRQPIAFAFQTVLPPAIGLYAALRLARRHCGIEAQFWRDYAALLAAALLVAVFVTRAGAVAGALAAVPLGWQVLRWLEALRRLARPLPRIGAMAGIALALVPALPATLLMTLAPARAAPPVRESACDIPAGSQTLRRLPRGEMLAAIDIGPRLLYETRHSVIATGHHRGKEGMREVIALFTGPPDRARDRLATRGTRYLVLCPDLTEPMHYARAYPDGLMARLLRGDIPEWLREVPVERGGMLVWRIVPEDQAGRKSIATPFMQ